MFQMFMIFVLTKWDFVYSFESFSLAHVQEWRVVHFTVLAPYCKSPCSCAHEMVIWVPQLSWLVVRSKKILANICELLLPLHSKVSSTRRCWTLTISGTIHHDMMDALQTLCNKFCVSLFFISKKTMSKRTAAKIGCGSFDQLDLQLLNNYRFFFPFCNYNFNNLGQVKYTVGKLFSSPFQPYITRPHISNL